MLGLAQPRPLLHPSFEVGWCLVTCLNTTTSEGGSRSHSPSLLCFLPSFLLTHCLPASTSPPHRAHTTNTAKPRQPNRPPPSRPMAGGGRTQTKSGSQTNRNELVIPPMQGREGEEETQQRQHATTPKNKPQAPAGRRSHGNDDKQKEQEAEEEDEQEEEGGRYVHPASFAAPRPPRPPKTPAFPCLTPTPDTPTGARRPRSSKPWSSGSRRKP